MARAMKQNLDKFKALLDQYNACFYQKDLEALKRMYWSGGDLVYFDNHAQCDSDDLAGHIEKVGHFFQSGKIEKLQCEVLRVFETGSAACVIARYIYPRHPEPSVRTTFYLEKENNQLKIRHIHFSFNPNEGKGAS